MASIRLIKRRIRTAKNIAQITKAMELVAAAKMKKAQAAALAGKLYAEKIYEMVSHLSGRASLSSHPLLMSPAPVGKRLIILLSTNKGLCGGLNTTLFRFLLQEYPDLKRNDIITIGKKGAELVTRVGAQVKADFSDTVPFVHVIAPVVSLATEEFVAGRVDSVELISNEFISPVKQQPRKKTLLPLTIEPAAAQTVTAKKAGEVSIEPSIDEVFNALLPHYIENQIRDAVLQGEASEHSARMIAMHNATENAKSLSDELTLVYNRIRQEKITYEITDMVTARLAVEV